MKFTDEQIRRYSRNMLLQEVGGRGQQKLLDSRVLVLGVGGLGSAGAMYLAAAGVGHLALVDSDEVDLSNLQRQIIHDQGQLGQSKVESARERLRRLNPDTRVVASRVRLGPENARQLVRGYDVVLEGADNLATKYVVNDACVLEKIPLVHGGILRFTGLVMTILPGKSACYRCVFRDPPSPGVLPSCEEAGVLGAIAGVIGSVQATEVLKILLGLGELLTDRVLTFDALRMRFRTSRWRRDPACPVCGEQPTLRAPTEPPGLSCDASLDRMVGPLP